MLAPCLALKTASCHGNKDDNSSAASCTLTVHMSQIRSKTNEAAGGKTRAKTPDLRVPCDVSKPNVTL